MSKFCLSLFLSLIISAPAIAADMGSDVEATTPNGDKVTLHPNGRWEFVETKKAVEAEKISKQYPENQVCPPGTQGGHFGLGGCIKPGDKDFNRGSLSGKGR